VCVLIKMLNIGLCMSVNVSFICKPFFVVLYRVIQEELPPLTELIPDDILGKKYHINLGPILNIYRVTFVIAKRTTVNCAWPLLM
jgi:uncharacterized membrane protein